MPRNKTFAFFLSNRTLRPSSLSAEALDLHDLLVELERIEVCSYSVVLRSIYSVDLQPSSDMHMPPRITYESHESVRGSVNTSSLLRPARARATAHS
jgi:hypothetical protein